MLFDEFVEKNNIFFNFPTDADLCRNFWESAQKECAKRCIDLIKDSVNNMSFEELLDVIEKEFLVVKDK